MTAEEVEQEYLATMGPDLGPVYHLLTRECQALHVDWAEHKILFGTSPERIDLLNETAPEFFGRLQGVLLERVLLQIARLMDPIKSGAKGKENATLLRLSQMVAPAIRPKIEELLKAAEMKCKAAQDWRKRRIAHTDLELALNECARPLDPVSRLKVDSALAVIADTLNVVESHYRNGCTVGYEWFHSPLGAIALLDVLRDGLEARKTEMERMMSGQLSPVDLAPKRGL